MFHPIQTGSAVYTDYGKAPYSPYQWRTGPNTILGYAGAGKAAPPWLMLGAAFALGWFVARSK